MKCPYRKTNTKTCTHQHRELNKGGKKACGYNYPSNCELFLDWVELKAKSLSELKKASKSPGDTSQ